MGLVVSGAVDAAGGGGGTGTPRAVFLCAQPVSNIAPAASTIAVFMRFAHYHMMQLKFAAEGADTESMRDRRTEARMLCADMVQVQWNRRHATALLEDISPSGACLQMELEVPIGSEICWESQHSRFAGVVRYCEYREIGWFIGVEFVPGTQWSQSTYEPQHLLDVKNLMPDPEPRP